MIIIWEELRLHEGLARPRTYTFWPAGVSGAAVEEAEITVLVIWNTGDGK